MAGDYLDEVHQRIAEFAEEFLEDDEERSGFIDGLMERRGYQRVAHWAPPEDPASGQPKQGLLKPPKPAKGGGQGQQGGGSYFRKGTGK